MNPPGAMPIFGRGMQKEPQPEPTPEPPVSEELSPEQIAIVHMRWTNLMDVGFSADEAFKLCENPGLDWHYAADLRASGCPFAIIVNLTSP